jgi:hypothetical protein
MNSVRHSLATLALLLCAAAALAQQAPEASASLRADATKLLVGDQARVFLSAQCDPSRSHIVWPVVPDSFGKLEVVKKDKIDTVKSGTLAVYTQRFYVSGWDSLDAGIPSFQIQVLPANGAPYLIQTDSLSFSVRTVTVDTTQAFKGIKGIREVSLNWRDYIGWIIGAGVLLLAAIGIIIWLKTRRKPAPSEPPPPPEPLHEKALRLLVALEAESLWQNGEVKEYYIRLTDVLRNYIEERFGIPALERTTDELTAAAKKHPELCLQADRLHRILATADMAKFARAQPTPAEHVAAMQDTKDLIIATIPKPAPDTASGSAAHPGTRTT